MSGQNGSRPGALQWVVVGVVGILVVTVVLGLNLIPRLNAGQHVLDGARPAFAPERLQAMRGGIDLISKNVDVADPILTSSGSAAAEVPLLIAFVAQQTGLTQGEVVAALAKNFPHTLALLQAIPLSEVTAEIPGLLAFLQQALGITQEELLAAMQQNFPHLTQSIVNLPTVTNGWDAIPGIDGLTRFDGTPVKSVPDLRTYFSADVIPVLETQKANYDSLDGSTTVNWIAPLLLAVGFVVIALAAVMVVLNLRGAVSRRLATAGAGVVLAVGIGVTVLALAISLVPRVTDGQPLLEALAPAMDADRVARDRVGIDLVSVIVDLEDPIMTAEGGAAAEVGPLVAFVAEQTGLSQGEVVAALAKNFPHTLALLQAIPLSEVSAEIPGLLTFLTGALGISQEDLLAAMGTHFPGLAQAVTNLTAVTDGWNAVPGIEGATRFDGTPIKSIPDVRTFFGADVVPVLETQHGNYDTLVKTSTINFIGPLVLAVGLIVIVYGLLMLFFARRRESGPTGASAPATTT